MARKVKCSITKEEGTNETFYKVNDKYYKSQEIYENDKLQKQLYKEIIDYVCNDFLNYKQGQIFPTSLTKKLKELSFYDNEVILKTLKTKSKEIDYWLQNKTFDSDYGKVSYIFAIVKNSINDIYKQWKHEKDIIKREITIDTSVTVDEIPISHKQKGSILEFLEEGDI
jgi:hypothetical protein